MLLKYVFFTISFFVLNTSFSQSFENTKLCQKAYKNIIALKLDSGIYYLKQENSIRPNNFFTVYLYNYIDFLKVYTSGSMAYYEETVKDNFSKRISQIQKTKAENSPYFLYFQAEIYLHSAILSVENKDYLTSIFHLRKALKKLELNEKEFPNFKANKKSLGLLYSILGSVPDNLKTGMSIIGLNGDINKGMKMLKTLSLDTTFENQHETATIYAFMLFHLNNEKEKAWEILKNNGFFNSNSLMDKFAIAHIGIYGFHNDEAIQVIENIAVTDDFVSFPLIDYILAIGKTYRQDKDANEYFQKFLNSYQGQDYLKSSYQKMAWNALINNKEDLYDEYILKIAKIGRKVIDADKQAAKEVDFLVPPDAVLLKARLFSDGNYLKEARELLNKYTLDDFMMPKDKVEYQYRLGRIYHKEKDFDKAILYYLKTMEFDNKVEAYYGANACYLIGNIYEKLHHNDLALKYYEKCLTLNGYEYENSIKQKAKAGFNRLKKSFF